MNNNKLTDELLVAFLEGKLSDSEKKEVQDLINQSDANFIKYSRLYASYKQMEQTEFEVAPDQLIEAANKKYGLNINKGPTIEMAQGFDFSNLIKWITNPRTLAYASLAASIAILISIQDPMIEKPEGGRRPVLVRSLKKTNKAESGLAVESIEGLNVDIRNDTIFVNQPFKFNRTLIVLSGSMKDILFRSDFINIDESFQFSDLSKSDSVYIIIETLGEEVYRNTFYLNN